MKMTPEKLLAAMAAIEKTAEGREQTAADSTRSGMTESAALQRHRAGGLREALTILKTFLTAEDGEEVADV